MTLLICVQISLKQINTLHDEVLSSSWQFNVNKLKSISFISKDKEKNKTLLHKNKNFTP